MGLTLVSFLLDSSVIAEWVRDRPDAGVVRWLAEVDEDRVFISAVTIAELRGGVARMAAGARRDRDGGVGGRGVGWGGLRGRILPVDVGVALELGGSGGDGFVEILAATGRRHRMTVATDSAGVRIFWGLGVEVLELGG